MLRAPGKSDGQTGTKILLDAMSKDKVHLAKFVLDALDGEIVDSRTEDAHTPLISSVLLPDGGTRCKFVELLLQRGASVNGRDGSGRTALTYACENGDLDAVKLLVRNNADPEIVDTWGNTALMYATVAGHSCVVEFLVRAFKRLGLQIDRQNKVGNSAVEVARFLGHTECIFALTNSSRKSRGCEGGAQEDAQPRHSLRCGSEYDTFERKAGNVVNKPDVLQTCNHADCLLVQNCTWQARPWIKQSMLPSMDSIDEFERGNDGSSSPTQGLDLSGSPKAPLRSPDYPSNSKHSKACERPTTSDDCLLPLIQSGELQKPIFFSPRPNRNTAKPSAHSALGILLTPILANNVESESGPDTFDFGVRRFHDNYYEKRCSLPTSVLSPTPVHFPKSRTVKGRETSPNKTETFPFTAPATTSTFSALSSKLLRRLTFPEIKNDARELEEPVLTSGRIPRSVTFPQGIKHPQVGSKPSIDSISSVKCEFDSYFRTPNS